MLVFIGTDYRLSSAGIYVGLEPLVALWVNYAQRRVFASTHSSCASISPVFLPLLFCCQDCSI